MHEFSPINGAVEEEEGEEEGEDGKRKKTREKQTNKEKQVGGLIGEK